MEKDGLIRRKIYNESPIRIEYEMTEKGMALEPILEQMSAFSMKYFPKEIFKNGKPRTYDEVYGYEKNGRTWILQFAKVRYLTFVSQKKSKEKFLQSHLCVAKHYSFPLHKL